MAPTYTTDVPDWIPDVIAASLYDTMFESALTLSGLATPYGDLEGRPGEQFTIPTLDPTTPADNLAETVPAVDDNLGSGGVPVTIKEAVKSISWTDRTRIQSGQDVNTIAGQRVGNAVNDRIELDLGAALVAGRDTSKDSTGAGFTLATIRAMRAALPAKLRRRGRPVLVATDEILSQLFDDANVNNASAFGSDAEIREGDFTRPFYGIRIVPVDDDVLPETVTVSAGTGPLAVLMASGMLVRAFQRRSQTETERDARARLSRIVGTCFHGEGVVDPRGVIVRRVS